MLQVRLWNFSSGQCLRECLPPPGAMLPPGATLARAYSGDAAGRTRADKGEAPACDISVVMGIQESPYAYILPSTPTSYLLLTRGVPLRLHLTSYLLQEGPYAYIAACGWSRQVSSK